MKFCTSQLTFFLQARTTRCNIRLLICFLGALTALVTPYSVLFHVLMVHEGQKYSWGTGLYWMLTVMSTLGFGDITFHSDLGAAPWRAMLPSLPPPWQQKNVGAFHALTISCENAR